jgi:hypothetical protein
MSSKNANIFLKLWSLGGAMASDTYLDAFATVSDYPKFNPGTSEFDHPRQIAHLYTHRLLFTDNWPIDYSL